MMGGSWLAPRLPAHSAVKTPDLAVDYTEGAETEERLAFAAHVDRFLSGR